ncbi:MAG TPA: hypothetical protein VJ874_00780, partial [Candidatus Thermoplasmatota archaeon]|nr:hypothetical protein [Candidatus Thermoplasmatota archaeon]
MRLPRRSQATLLGMATAVLLAGCSSAPPAPPAAEMQWTPMAVELTSLQPPELLGTYHLAWREGRFGVLAEDVAGLPQHAVVEGSLLSTSALGQSWVRFPLAEYQATHPLAIRYTLWDLPRLLDSAPDSSGSGDVLTASLDLDASGDRETRLELRKESGRIVWGRVETPLDPEAPFTFTREDPHPFPMVPEPSLEPLPADEGDARAQAGHQVLLGWIKESRGLLGAYPEEVNPETLLLQSFNQEWPTSPYDGKPMADVEQEGHFQWDRCSPEDATFVGLGWDGAILEESFGKGCARAPSGFGGGEDEGLPLPPLPPVDAMG